MFTTHRLYRSTLPQTTSSVSHTLIYLWRAATISTTRYHQLPRLSHTSATLAQYLATFRTLWRLFFHSRCILTNLVTILKKKEYLSYRSVGIYLQYCLASARSDSRHSVASLGVCSEQWAAELSASHNPADWSVNHLQNSVCKNLSLTDYLDL